MPDHTQATTPRRPACLLPRALLIDADDTLWEGSIYYARCREQFTEFMATLGVDPHSAAEELRRTQLEAIPTFGYGALGFAAGLEAACRRLLAARGLSASAATLAAARAIGLPVFDPPMVLLPGVERALEALRPSNWLALVTKGNVQAQANKLECSGLAGYFDVIYIEPEKDAALYDRIVRENALDPLHTYMVGNSPRSDINAATQAGLRAIHIPHPATWAGERAEILHPDRVVTLPRFADLPAWLEAAPQSNHSAKTT